MNWPRQTLLHEDGLDEFVYDQDSEDNCVVLYCFGEDETINRLDLGDESRWDEFLNMELFKNPGHHRSYSPGVCILFCPRSTSVFEDIQSDLSDLCMTRDRWATIVRRFGLHSLLIQVIKTKTVSASANERAEVLQQHTITTSSYMKDSFAISSTYSIGDYLSLAVVLGSTKEQVDCATRLLDGSYEAIGHPYLVPGLSIELIYLQLRSIVDDIVDESVLLSRAMPKQRLGLEKGWDLMNQVQDLRTRSMQIKEEVMRTQRHLGNILPPRSDLDDPMTGRFHDRCDDIRGELDSLLNKVSNYADEMSFIADTIRGELARGEAASATRLAQSSVVIAFVAMIYLPMTSVATIFAMPVFDFHNDWRDLRFRPVNRSSKMGVDAEGPVFSGYFWIWLALALGLTILTGFGWWYFQGDHQRGSGLLAEAKQPTRNDARVLRRLFHKGFKAKSASNQGTGVATSSGTSQPEPGFVRQRSLDEAGGEVQMADLPPRDNGSVSSLAIERNSEDIV